jgi:RNA polymerase sigma-70 factor, ECF subfamily
MKVARFLLAIRSKWLSTLIAQIIEVNGQPGIITLVDGCIQSVVTLLHDLVNNRNSQ